MVNNLLTFAYLSVIYLSFIFRGSFFQFEQTLFAFVMLIIFILWLLKSYKGKEAYTVNLQDGLFLLVIVGYLTSLINPVDSIGAWKELYLILTYFFVYLMGKDFLFKGRFLFVGFLLILTGSISMIGLLAYYGYQFPFEALYLGNRIGSVLQYPNTLAALNIVGIVVALGVTLFNRLLTLRAISFLVVSINLTTLMLTISRGGMLVLAFILFIYLILLPKEKKIPYVIFNALGFGIVLFFLRDLAGSFGLLTPGLKYLSIILISSLILFIGLDYLLRLIDFSKSRVYLYGAVAVTGSLALFIFFGFQLLPENLIKRLSDINFDTLSVRTRLDFYEAAWGILKDYPFGIGGEGWGSVYYDYIPDFFIAREVHSHPLQIGVEAGFIGMIAYLLFSLVSIYRLIKGYLIEESSTRYYYLIIGLSFMTLFLHSLIDFDLSYTSVALLFYALASQAPRGARVIRINKEFNKGILTATLLFSLYLLYGLGTMAIGSYYKEQGEKLFEHKQYAEAIASFEETISWMPRDSMSYLYIAMFKEGITAGEKEQLLEEAYSYNSYNPEITHYYIQEKLELEHYDGLYELALPLVERQPLPENFKLYFESARYSIRTAVNIEDLELLERYSQEVLDIYTLSQKHGYKLREVDNLVLGQALFTSKQYEKAEEQFLLASKNSFIMAESEMWLILTYEQLGMIEKANDLRDKPLNRFLPKNDNFLHLTNIF